MLNIVLTGCSSGIGQAILNYLIKTNFVYAIGRKKPKIVSKNYKFIKCDLNNLKNLDAKLSKIKKADVLINNSASAELDKEKIKNFKKILNLNLVVPYILSEKLKKKLLKSKNPSIINVCSINSYQAFPNNPGYVSSKGGLLSLTRALALDYGSYKIRVNSISPGYIRTSMTAKSYNKKVENRKRLSRMLIKRWGKPEDIVGLVEYLISNKSSYVTGQDFVVDGGWLSKGL